MEDVQALGRQKQIRGAYADAAAALAATGKKDDRALAEDIAGFVADMPPAVSRRLQRAREIMMADRVTGSATGPARETGVDRSQLRDGSERNREPGERER